MALRPALSDGLPFLLLKAEALRPALSDGLPFVDASVMGLVCGDPTSPSIFDLVFFRSSHLSMIYVLYGLDYLILIYIMPENIFFRHIPPQTGRGKFILEVRMRGHQKNILPIYLQ